MGNKSRTRASGDAIEKECTKCTQWKPATLNFFSGFKQGVMGLHPWCRECLRLYTRTKQARTGKPVRKILATFGTPPKFQHPTPRSITEILANVTRDVDEGARFKAYLITNLLTGAVYVGITERKLKDRWKQHLIGGGKGQGYLLHQMMHRDGIDNFKFEFIACAVDRHNLHLLEMQLIGQFQSVESGYNQTRGGAAGESVGTEITVKGRTFISINSAAREFGVDEATAIQRLRRYGWTPEQAFGLTKAPLRKGRIFHYEINGNRFDSFVAACAHHGLDDSAVRGRLKKGWSVRQAFGFDPAPARLGSNCKPITVANEYFSSLAAAAKRFGVQRHSAAKRISQGMTPEQAFGLSPSPQHTRAGKSIEVDGVHYQSLAAAARKFGVEPRLVSGRIRKGWTIDQAFGLATPKPLPASSIGENVELNGVIYVSHAQAAKTMGLDPRIVHKRLRKFGWTLEQAFGLEPPPVKRSNSAKAVTIAGNIFETLSDACLAFNITQSAVRRRMTQGMTLEDALTKPSQKAKSKK